MCLAEALLRIVDSFCFKAVSRADSQFQIVNRAQQAPVPAVNESGSPAFDKLRNEAIGKVECLSVKAASGMLRDMKSLTL